jgi:hypothetical protein
VEGVLVEYRVVDYADASGEWVNTDEGAPEPTLEDIYEAVELNVGWTDTDGNWHYRWLEGPFSEDFELEDAIAEASDKYGIDVGT